MQADQNFTTTMHTEFDMPALLFPKEQGPGLNPNPPREVGTIFLAQSWLFRELN